MRDYFLSGGRKSSAVTKPGGVSFAVDASSQLPTSTMAFFWSRSGAYHPSVNGKTPVHSYPASLLQVVVCRRNMGAFVYRRGGSRRKVSPDLALYSAPSSQLHLWASGYVDSGSI